MKTKLTAALITVAAIAGCTGTKTADDGATKTARHTASVNINGKWEIECIMSDDSTYVRPAEETHGECNYFLFTDSTYSISTNCNSLAGSYTLHGDSIALGDGMMTEMACDNMTTEDALRKTLPHIVKVDVENDSIIRLNSSAGPAHIVLRRVASATE